MRVKFKAALLAVSAVCAAGFSLASSHREAPFITTQPKVDGTDFYMFRSYEANRSDYITLIANYLPLQDPYGGPNYFSLDPNALYEIHIDNNGNAAEDITFQFRFANALRSTTLPIGPAGNTVNVAIPLIQSGAVSGLSSTALNLNETYSVNVVRGNRRTGTVQPVVKTSGGSATFEKPVDYIGEKTLGNSAAYATYAGQHIHNVNIPGCPAGRDTGRVFVGQRQEGFGVNLGPIFDLVNANLADITNPSLINAFAANSIQDKSVTSIAIEVHRDCLTAGTGAGTDPVIGGWTTASLRQARLLNGAPSAGHQASERVGGAWTQVSRLGHPLVNEVVIGLPDKDRFNASRPAGDGAAFLTYVTNPTLPALLGLVLTNNTAGLAPTNFPRTDLVSVFLTGIATINRPANVGVANAPVAFVPSEMLRLNTSSPVVPFASQNRLGIVGSLATGGSDFSGFPNGRRPQDDVVDVSLVAMLGGLCFANGTGNTLGFNSVIGLTSACNNSTAIVPAGSASLTVHDGVDQRQVATFLPGFPYLNTPLPGNIPD
ncbi:MAG: DUF4331 domain-containing protein [Burkholderiaceae bacterium]